MMTIDDQRPRGLRRASTAGGTTLLVCEHSGDWAHQLRRLLDAVQARDADATGTGRDGVVRIERAVRIVETRSAAECLEALSRSPEAIVALELTAGNCDAVVGLLTTVDARFPAARAAVLAARSMRGYRGLLHELGAVCVVCSPWQLPTLVEIVQRHRATPRHPSDLTAEIWQGLPWQ